MSDEPKGESNHDNPPAEFFTLTGEMFCTADFTGHFLHLNPVWEETLGYTREALRARPFFELIHPDDREQTIAEIARLAEGGVTIRFKNRYRHKQGGYRTLLWKALGKPDEGIIYATARDVTQADESEAALRESRSLLQLVLDAIPVRVFWKDTESRYLGCNRLFAGDAGLSDPEEIVGKDDYALAWKDQAELYRADDAFVIRSGRSKINYEEPQTTPLGKNIWLRTSKVPLTDSGGNIIGVMGCYEDITERKHTEEALRKREAELRQSQRMEAVGQLAGGVAHDFNNLLTIISGHCELADQSLSENDPARRDLKQVRQASDRAAVLTRQLLAFGRKQVFSPRVLDLNRTIKNLNEMLNRIIPENVEFVLEADPDLHCVMADPGQMDQVFMNLMVNARDAMPKGGTITIRTKNQTVGKAGQKRYPGLAPGRYVVTEVADTGFGMGEATLSHIFEPFFTTKSVGEGSGLGLAVVYGIVKQSKGCIYADSAPGEGTCFQVFLPVCDAEVAEEERSMPAKVLPRGDEAVLLVEDNSSLRKLANRILTRQGYKVQSVGNPAEALSFAADHGEDIDLLLTDLVMPGMSGAELARQITQGQPRTKVLLMTGYAADTLKGRGLDKVTQHIVHKPFTLEGLAAKVREVLDSGDRFSG